MVQNRLPRAVQRRDQEVRKLPGNEVAGVLTALRHAAPAERISLHVHFSLVESEAVELPEEQRDYLERLSYTEEQAALYLLGTLVAEIANAQWRLGPGGKNGDKTILNKINYAGMTVSRTQRLATDLFDKLTQYRDRNRRPLLRERSETAFAQAQALLTKNKENWSLSATETVYYILSGYSDNDRPFSILKRRTLNAMCIGLFPIMSRE